MSVAIEVKSPPEVKPDQAETGGRPSSEIGGTGRRLRIGGGTGRRGDGGGRRLGPDSYQLGMWLALASISMMFIGFSSAYILGQGTNSQWRAMAAPPFVWINTVILLASSLSLELARRAAGRHRVEAMDDPDLFAGSGLSGWPALDLEAVGRSGHLPERQSP